MKTIHFEGRITTMTPYTSSTKQNASVPKGQAKRVARMQLGADTILCILSSNIKGALRRSCEDVSYEAAKALTDEEKPFSLHDSYVGRLGGIKGGGEEVGLSPTDYLDIRKKNAMYSLFGGNEPFMDGHIIVEEARAPVGLEAEVIDGVRKDDFKSSPELIERLTDSDIEAFLERQGITKDMSKAKKEERTLLQQMRKESNPSKVAELEKSLSKVREKLKANKVVSTQMPLDGFEAIPAGTQLSHNIRIKTGNLVEAGLLIKGLERFSYHPYLGAKVANGMGQVAMHYDVSVTSPETGKESLGTIEVLPFGGIKVSGQVETALSAWNDYIQQGSEKVDFRKPL